MALGLWIVVAALLVVGVRRVVAGHPPTPPGLRTFAAREVATLEAIGEVFYPPGHGVSPSGADAGVTRYLDRYLAAGRARQRRLVRALLLLLEHATLVFPVWSAGLSAFRRLSSLDPAAREAYLEGWETSRWFLRRLCFTSIRALFTMGYFSDATVLRELGLAPREISPRIVEADLLYPRIGASRGSIALGAGDLTPERELPPLGNSGPLAAGFESSESDVS
jgi:hypothetical protein